MYIVCLRRPPQDTRCPVFARRLIISNHSDTPEKPQAQLHCRTPPYTTYWLAYVSFTPPIDFLDSGTNLIYGQGFSFSEPAQYTHATARGCVGQQNFSLDRGKIDRDLIKAAKEERFWLPLPLLLLFTVRLMVQSGAQQGRCKVNVIITRDRDKHQSRCETSRGPDLRFLLYGLLVSHHDVPTKLMDKLIVTFFPRIAHHNVLPLVCRVWKLQ